MLGCFSYPRKSIATMKESNEIITKLIKEKDEAIQQLQEKDEMITKLVTEKNEMIQQLQERGEIITKCIAMMEKTNKCFKQIKADWYKLKLTRD